MIYKLVSGSRDNTLKIWKNNQFLNTLFCHTNIIFNVTQLSDNRIISESIDNTIRIWKISSSECIFTEKIILDLFFSYPMEDLLVLQLINLSYHGIYIKKNNTPNILSTMYENEASKTKVIQFNPIQKIWVLL